MKSFRSFLEEKKTRCWKGYEPTPGKKAFSKGSCRKVNEEYVYLNERRQRRFDNIKVINAY